MLYLVMLNDDIGWIIAKYSLTHKWFEMCRCVISTMVTAALVLKHQEPVTTMLTKYLQQMTSLMPTYYIHSNKIGSWYHIKKKYPVV